MLIYWSFKTIPYSVISLNPSKTRNRSAPLETRRSQYPVEYLENDGS